MKMTPITIAVVWVLAMLLLAPLEAKAGAHGFGMHASKFRVHFRSAHHFRPFRHHRAFTQWPLYGYGYYDDDATTYSAPVTIVRVPEPPRAVGCQHSEQTVTVPSENGETRQVTIMRC
jgi:hypothetical protein